MDEVKIDEQGLRKPIEERRERGDLDDPKKIKRKEILSRLQERQNVEDFGWILSDIRGRRFIWKFLSKCQVFESCYTGNNTTFFNLGERNAGLRMIAMINEYYPAAYLKMIEEAKIPQIE